MVQFYKKNDGRAKQEKEAFEKVGSELKDMIRVGALDCDEFWKICDAEKVTAFPTYRVYPPFPAPTQDFQGDALDGQKLKQMATKWIGNKAIEINLANHDTFTKEKEGTPKILLFTDKEKGFPLLIKALSEHFEKTLDFGLVRSSETALTKKYKVKTFPALLILKGKDTKPIFYEGTDFSYSEVFRFINVYSETFIFPGDAEVKQT